MSKVSRLTHERLKELLRYDPDTGVFYWKETRGGMHKGAVAGALGHKGYWEISIDMVNYRAHRLAWFYVHGAWPKHQIDHINRIPSDNRISNLRDVTALENQRNKEKHRTSRLPEGARSDALLSCKCDVCGNALQRKAAQYFNDKRKGHKVTCSSKCRYVLVAAAKQKKRMIVQELAA